MAEDAQIREMKKQTRLLAEKQASRDGAIGFLASLAALLYVAAHNPDLGWPAWGPFAGAVALGVFSYFAALKRLTRD